MLKFSLLALVPALLLGLLLPLSLAPFHWWPLAVLSAGGLFYLLECAPKRLVLLGWVFGLGKYGLGASWIYVSIHQYGNASVALAAFMVALFVAFMALFPLTQIWLYARLRSASHYRNGVVFTGLWVLWEWLLTWFLSGFPWLFAGSGHLLSPFAGYAPVGGVFLVSLAVVAAGCALACAVLQWRANRAIGRGVLIPIALVVGLLALGQGLAQVQWVVPQGSKTVALVQGNVDQSSKWLPSQRGPILERLESLSEPHWDVDLLLWPEAAITIYEHQATPLLERWQQRGAATGTTMVLGLPAVEVLPGSKPDYRFSNLARAVGVGEGRYAKRRLVPFGEYVPLENLLRGLIAFFDLPMSRASAGAMSQPLLQLGDHQAAMAICYEVAYPSLVNGDLPAADVLLTISNDAWFGGSVGPHQHLQIAQMRALENGRYMLRATNTGLTAIIDERGAVQAELPQFEAGVLRGSYRLMQGQTPFGRFGSTPVLLAIVLALVVMVFLRALGQSKQQNS